VRRLSGIEEGQHHIRINGIGRLRFCREKRAAMAAALSSAPGYGPQVL